MKTILILSIALFSFNSYSQSGAFEDSLVPTERLSLSISPMSLFDMYNGASYKAGLTIRPYKMIRLTADVGGYWAQFSNEMTLWKNLKGYNFKATAGTYLGYMNLYNVGVEYQYKIQEFNYNDSVPSLPAFSAQVNKFVHVFNVYGSYDTYLSNRFYIELRAGVGLRYRDIFNTHSDELSNSLVWGDSKNTGKLTTKQKLMPNLNFAIRINYILWEN